MSLCNTEAAPKKAELLLRLSLGVLMLLAGIGKFLGEGGYAGFVENMGLGFAETPLGGAMFLVTAMAYLIPVAEVVLGVLLLSGFWRTWALFGTGILFLLFIIGLMIQGNMQVANWIFVYLLVTAFTLSLPGSCLMGGKK